MSDNKTMLIGRIRKWQKLSLLEEAAATFLKMLVE